MVSIIIIIFIILIIFIPVLITSVVLSLYNFNDKIKIPGLTDKINEVKNNDKVGNILIGIWFLLNIFTSIVAIIGIFSFHSSSIPKIISTSTSDHGHV